MKFIRSDRPGADNLTLTLFVKEGVPRAEIDGVPVDTSLRPRDVVDRAVEMARDSGRDTIEVIDPQGMWDESWGHLADEAGTSR